MQLDSQARTLAWPNGADFDPAMLYDWPEYASEMERRAAKWEVAVF